MLKDRVEYFEYLFDMLTDTNSLNEKKDIIADIPSDYKADFDYIIYCLSNQVKFGYTYYYDYINDGTRFNEEWTIKDCLEYLQKPMKEGNLTYKNIALTVGASYNYKDFFSPIVNKTLKLGIGNSLLPKLDYSAMLAKKYEGPSRTMLCDDFYITEKLDGNRCIAHYENGKWVFTSRNGKIMHVDFDMTGLPTHLVYDGEVLSPRQVRQSEEIKRYIYTGFCDNLEFQDMFNSTSGLINQHTTDKELIFNIFDIQEKNVRYSDRREYLDSFKTIKLSKDVRIVPVLGKADIADLNNIAFDLLDKVTSLGGEGIMINLGNRTYEHKRTDSLLKLKKVQTMDMVVVNTTLGTGKYEGLVGALECLIHTDDDKVISCSVGSGLSDEQRVQWTMYPEKILHHIVEISYFSLSQNENEKGSNLYSLRFPRLKKVREDKTKTSEN